MIPHLAIALSTTGQVTWFNTSIGFRIAGTISGAIHMVDALHLKASDSSVVGVSQESSWTAAQSFVSFRLAIGINATNSM